MVPLVAAGLISAAGSVVNSGINSFSASAQSRSQYHMNRKLMQEQAQLNHDLWQEQNEYNTPANQMARYRDAGLNPNLIYGLGDSGNASSPAKSFDAIETEAAPGYRMPSNLWNDAADTYLRSKQIESNINAQKSQSKLAESQEGYWRQKTIDEMFKNDFNKELRPWLKEIQIQNVEESWKRQDKMDSDIAFNQAKISEIQSKFKLTSAQTMEVYQKIRQMAVQMSLDMERVNTEKSKQAANYGLVERYGYLNRETEKNIDLIEARRENYSLSNQFDFQTFNQRVNTITNIATESLYRAQNGGVLLDMNKFRLNYMQTEGLEIGTAKDGYISSEARGISNALYRSFKKIF